MCKSPSCWRCCIGRGMQIAGTVAQCSGDNPGLSCYCSEMLFVMTSAPLGSQARSSLQRLCQRGPLPWGGSGTASCSTSGWAPLLPLRRLHHVHRPKQLPGGSEGASWFPTTSAILARPCLTTREQSRPADTRAATAHSRRAGRIWTFREMVRRRKRQHPRPHCPQGIPAAPPTPQARFAALGPPLASSSAP